jgi:type IV fimbrial biogenesis protein FimT
LATQANDFMTALNLARSEAVKRGRPVTVCRSTDGASCSGSGVNWETGWIVFTDANGDGVVDAGDGILRVFDALPSGYTLRSAGISRVTYDAGGFSVGVTEVWTLCDPDGEFRRARGVILIGTGRARAAEDIDGDGVRESSNSNPASDLTCPP